MPATATRTTVLVVGAGPVGLTTAAVLASEGVDVVVLERDAGPIEQSRAVWIHPRTLELWERIDLPQRATARGVLVDRIDIHVDAEHRSTVWYDGTGLTDHQRGLMLEQAVTQRLLLDRLAELGVEPRWSTTLTRLQQRGDTVIAHVDEPDGARGTIEAAYVIGADGASSTVRGEVGLSLEGDTYDRAFFLADVVVGSPLHHDRANLTLAGPHTLAWLPLAGEDRWRIVGNLTDQQQAPEGPGYGRSLGIEEVEQLIAPVGLDLDVGELQWATTYRSHHRIAPRYQVGRVFIAGDAAHLHSPAGGLGMNTGIGDATNLAWKLAAVAAGHADPSLLDTYEQERRPVAQRVLSTSDRLFNLQADTEGAVAALRPKLFPWLTGLLEKSSRARRQLYVWLSALETSYEGDGLAADAGSHAGVAAGDRLPWIELADGRSTHALVADGPHTLLTVVPGGRHEDVLGGRHEDVPAPATTPTLPVENVVVPDERVAAELRATADRPVHVLVRPDRHIAAIGPDPRVVTSYLRQWRRNGDRRPISA